MRKLKQDVAKFINSISDEFLKAHPQSKKKVEFLKFYAGRLDDLHEHRTIKKPLRYLKKEMLLTENYF